MLEGERLLLRPLAPADWEALYGVASDPLLWAQHPAHDRWQEPVFRAYFADALAHKGAVVAVDKNDSAIIGSSRWQAFCADNGGVVEIGWTFLARRCWGTGLNPEMKRLMLEHAFAHVARVEFRIGEGNLRSRKACERIGGVLTDRFEDGVAAGQPTRHLVYEITREAYAAGPLAA